jgi:hypothetical protein
MKRLFLSAIAIIILTACSSGRNQADLNVRKGPSLPTKPTIQQNDLQANLIDTVKPETGQNKDNTDIAGLVNQINQNIQQKNVTDDDINRGWYYGSEDEKKWGTPNNWVWINEGDKSRWISPSAIDQEKDIEMDSLCRKTAGNYAISCVERDLPHCEHIAKSECRCADNTKWIDNQGCVLINDKDEPVKINANELKQGWYGGAQNAKKLDTPLSWIWVENGDKSQWQNPGAL